jgi:hypothetical protein
VNQPGRDRRQHQQHLHHDQQKDIPGHADRTLSIVTQQGGRQTDTDQEAQDRQQQRAPVLNRREGAPRQQRPDVRLFAGAPRGQPATQTGAAMRRGMGFIRSDLTGDPVQIE